MDTNECKGQCNGQRKRQSTEQLVDKELILSKLNIRPTDTVADIGCGDGYMAREFAKLVGSAGRVFAVERAMEKVEQLRQDTVGDVIADAG